MPKVGGKSYSYTTKGRKAAKAARKRIEERKKKAKR